MTVPPRAAHEMFRAADTFVAGSGYDHPGGLPPVAGHGSLPSDVLSSAVQRVRTASLGFATVWLAVLVTNVVARRFLVAGPLPGLAGWPLPGALFVGVGFLASLTMAMATRRLAHRPGLVLDLGLWFLVLSAALVGVLNFWNTELHAGRISWIAAMILGYPAIAPNTPTKTLWAGLAAASMDFVGLGVGALRGLDYHLTTIQTLWLVLPNYICAVLAVVPARVIRTLGRKVTEAREMGSYRLERLIGRGGMGEVHAASHRMIARPAAVKFIRPELLGSTSSGFRGMVAERFRREAEAAAALRSPHTIQLYDFGVAGDCTPYYVMELLDGIDLQTLVERFGPVSPARAIHLLRQVCESLAEAHATGLVHRDIKPSNIHVGRQGLIPDFVKVLDFGLVKRYATGGETPDPAITSVEERGTTGTPAYMAPELGEGDGAPSPRSDLYAVGCVAYWMLTGRLVFPASGMIQTMYKHAHEAPVPPSVPAPNPLPVALDRVVMACLAKHPADRPQSAEALDMLLASVPLEQPWTREDATQWWARQATLEASASP